jgi:hypothetical protein
MVTYSRRKPVTGSITPPPGGHFYGDWRAYPRVVEANRDRVQPDGRSLGETGTIHPGWTLVIPEPTHGVRIDEDG